MKISTQNLKSALAPILPLSSGGTSIPALSMVRLQTEWGRLQIQGTNLAVHAVATAECEGDLPPILVPASAFKSLVDSANGTIEMTAESGRLLIQSVWKSKLPTLDPDGAQSGFPLPPKADGKLIAVNPDELARGIEGTAWAASDPKLSRPILECCCVRLSANELRCESADGKWLALYRKPFSGEAREILIPDAHCKYVADALREPEAAISANENYVFVAHKNGSVAVKLLEGSFPNTAQITDSKAREIGTLKPKELLAHLRTASSVHAGDFCPGEMQFGSSGLSIEVIDEKSGGEYRAEIEGKFRDAAVKIDVRRFIEVLSRIESETVAIGLTDTDAMHFNDGEFKFILQLLRGNRKEQA